MYTKSLQLPLILSLLISLFSSCGNQQNITISKIAGAKVISVSQKGIELELSVKIKNPNSFGFTIYPSDFSIKINNSDVGKAQLKDKVRVKSHSEEEHKLIVKSEFSDLFSGGLSSLMVLIQKKSLDVSLKGELKAGTLFYKKTFPVDLKENISLTK